MRWRSDITLSGLVLSMVLVVIMGCGYGLVDTGGSGDGADDSAGGGSGGGGDDNGGDNGGGSGGGGGAGSPMFDRWCIPSFFRGVDIGYFNYGSGTKSVDDFMALKATGANLAQIQSNEGTVGWAPPYATNQDGVTALDDMVAWCGQAELYYVIAVREGPGRQSVDLDADDTIWQNSDEQQRYGQMLADIVARYQGDPYFAAINVMVEPNPLRTQIWDTIQTPEELGAALTDAGINVNAMMTLFINKIRAVDATLPIIVQGVVWSNPQWWSLVEKQDDPYVIYDFHTYEPSPFTHPECAAADCPGVSYPGEYYGQVYDRTFLEEIVFAEVIA
ncbi:MAG: glycoside hydrolase family 5 protein, partial [Planctomycetes bacterium]|nr:glycoside hydrolase family 5 protein [Planctomycetota bacterium]